MNKKMLANKILGDTQKGQILLPHFVLFATTLFFKLSSQNEVLARHFVGTL